MCVRSSGRCCEDRPAAARGAQDCARHQRRDVTSSGKSQSYPLVYTLFHTRLRTGEVIGLRWGVVDLRAGMLDVRYSRTRGEYNPPKTMNSQRTITLQPDVVAVLRAAQPLHVTTDTFVFTTPTGLPLDTDRLGRYSGTRGIPVRASAPSS